MINFHAVMLDETRCEFGVDLTADTRADAYEWLRDNYPESSCVQLESPEDTAQREQRIYAELWDDEEDYGDE